MSSYDPKDDASYWDAFEAEVEKSTPAKVDNVIAQLPVSVKVWRTAGAMETRGGGHARNGVEAAVTLEDPADDDVDMLVEGDAELYVVRLQTLAACSWVEENIAAPEHMWIEELALAVEPPFIADIVVAAQAAGLRVRMV